MMAIAVHVERALVARSHPYPARPRSSIPAGLEQSSTAAGTGATTRPTLQYSAGPTLPDADPAHLSDSHREESPPSSTAAIIEGPQGPEPTAEEQPAHGDTHPVLSDGATFTTYQSGSQSSDESKGRTSANTTIQSQGMEGAAPIMGAGEPAYSGGEGDYWLTGIGSWSFGDFAAEYSSVVAYPDALDAGAQEPTGGQ